MQEKNTRPTVAELYREAFPKRRRGFFDACEDDEIYDDDDTECTGLED